MCKAEAELRGTEKSNPVKRFGVLCGTFKPGVSLRYLADSSPSRHSAQRLADDQYVGKSATIMNLLRCDW
jgi:hypothetical protein